MKKRGLQILGVLLIIVGGVLILNSFSGITGFVVFGETGQKVGGAVGALLVLGGVLVFVVSEIRHRKVLREIDEALRSGRAGTYREAEQMARKLGYSVEEGGNHMTVYDERHNVVTQIPRHGRDVPTGLYRAILKKLRDHAD